MTHRTRSEKALGLAGAGMFLLAGCSGSFTSSLVAVSGTLSSPMFGEPPTLPVVYPAPAGGARSPDLMVQTHGPAWRSIEGDYPEYRFNP